MIELTITDMTRMREGLCVIGLVETPRLRSVRPMPSEGFAWRGLPYRRCDTLACDLFLLEPIAPHVEDALAMSHRKAGSVSEEHLVDRLRQAETAATLEEMFGAPVSLTRGGAAYVHSRQAARSICGCEISSVRFSFGFYPKIRAAVRLRSGEVLSSLPLVDRDWNDFADQLAATVAGEQARKGRLRALFDALVRRYVDPNPIRFARVGLARPDAEGRCWLMLDSLFPLPKCEWAENLPAPPTKPPNL